MSYQNDLILIVDDDEAVQQTMFTIIEHEIKCKVICTSNPKQAFEFLKNGDPTIIILDMQMPVMDGLTALKYFKTFPSTENIPVIACTATANKELLLNLVKLGINDYLVKPIDKTTFVEKIFKILRMVHHEEEVPEKEKPK